MAGATVNGSLKLKNVKGLLDCNPQPIVSL